MRVCVSTEEKKLLASASDREGLKFSTWARMHLLKLATANPPERTRHETDSDMLLYESYDGSYRPAVAQFRSEAACIEAGKQAIRLLKASICVSGKAWNPTTAKMRNSARPPP
jgi:hypothetical protein